MPCTGQHAASTGIAEKHMTSSAFLLRLRQPGGVGVRGRRENLQHIGR